MFGHDNQDQEDNQVTPTEHHDQTDQSGHQDDSQHGQDDNSASSDLGGYEVPVAAAGTTAAPSAVATDDLLDIKQEALEALSPLVGQLDQTPEEQFRTTMMMIQASDNHALVRVAYEAAKHISNEKERAQALLDIVNEINYFTQHAQAS